jgi:hypothetical protein
MTDRSLYIRGALDSTSFAIFNNEKFVRHSFVHRRKREGDVIEQRDVTSFNSCCTIPCMHQNKFSMLYIGTVLHSHGPLSIAL